ncbi:MAG: AEC family transporter [Tabrizicola sp.]|jgi:malonate transporter and related proteins|uniref:AEC family transporter n=1 Tax=Tabrizicola sp. TaxID=2005166 RepID=UPI001B679D92|nr:AEC family transporter [Tabrizicola sp.]
MLAIFVKTLPFFALIGVGYVAGRTRFFSVEATAYLTRFVFYFALSAMLFGFAANLDVAAIFDWPFVFAYTLGTGLVWFLVAMVALARGTSREDAVFEAHTGVIGNVGFLGIPMLALLLGPQSVGPVLLVLAVDLIVFSSFLTMAITGLRAGRVSAQTFGILAVGLAKNPMIVSVVLGIAWGATGLALPGPISEFLTMLGAAATPCALFAIGASLSGRSAERVEVAAWLASAKLVLHPLSVAGACWLFGVTGYAAGVMIAAAALPVAGNVFILAQHYRVAPQRVSTAILLSTAASVLTVTAVIALISQGGYI